MIWWLSHVTDPKVFADSQAAFQAICFGKHRRSNVVIHISSCHPNNTLNILDVHGQHIRSIHLRQKVTPKFYERQTPQCIPVLRVPRSVRAFSVITAECGSTFWKRLCPWFSLMTEPSYKLGVGQLQWRPNVDQAVCSRDKVAVGRVAVCRRVATSIA